MFIKVFNQLQGTGTHSGKCCSELRNAWVTSSIAPLSSWNTVHLSFLIVPSCLMRTDGQTDMTKLIVAFRNFVYYDRSETTGEYEIFQLFG